MRKIHFVVIFIILFINNAFTQNFPDRSSTLVNDYTGTLTSSEISNLENKLALFNNSNSAQICVVIIQSLEGTEIANYSTTLEEKWWVDVRKDHTGVMILMAKKERKVIIRTYNVEEKIDDVICDRIIQNTLIPNFKQQNFYNGFNEATDNIITLLKGEPNTTRKVEQKADDYMVTFIVSAIVGAFIFFITSIILLIKYARKSNQKHAVFGILFLVISIILAYSAFHFSDPEVISPFIYTLF